MNRELKLIFFTLSIFVLMNNNSCTMNTNDDNPKTVTKVEVPSPSTASTTAKKENTNLIKCSGGTVNYIAGVKVKMMLISKKDENLPDTEQKKTARIHLPEQGLVDLKEQDVVNLAEGKQLVVKEIMPYTLETNGFVLFELVEGK